ncbi:MAG: STAS domain-containing protein [Spirochaetes bacterium]|nr:STAS domain-containing protein [Spirochaetota bacterium]MBN2772552.1 STAS domain-containing protein [Spirochaetota bacterium]
MECKVIKSGADVTEAEIKGDCTIYNAAEIKKFISKYYDKSDSLVLNLSGVDEIDSSFFQLLLALKKDAGESNKRVSFIAHSIPVLKYIDLYGAAAMFGDRLVVKKEDRDKFDFRYGLKTVKGASGNESR